MKMKDVKQHSPLLSLINSYKIIPNEYGVVNEDLRYISQGFGYKIQIDRNGHCEFMLCLEGFVQEDTKCGQTRSFMPDPHNRVLRSENNNLIESFIQIFVNYYGLTIDSIFNEDGTLALPRMLSC